MATAAVQTASGNAGNAWEPDQAAYGKWAELYDGVKSFLPPVSGLPVRSKMSHHLAGCVEFRGDNDNPFLMPSVVHNPLWLQSALLAFDVVQHGWSVEDTYTRLETEFKAAGDKRKMLVTKEQW